MYSFSAAIHKAGLGQEMRRLLQTKKKLVKCVHILLSYTKEKDRGRKLV